MSWDVEILNEEVIDDSAEVAIVSFADNAESITVLKNFSVEFKIAARNSSGDDGIFTIVYSRPLGVNEIYNSNPWEIFLDESSLRNESIDFEELMGWEDGVFDSLDKRANELSLELFKKLQGE